MAVEQTDYKNGLFQCFSDMKLSCLTCICPCYTQGKNAEALGEDCLVHGLIGFAGIGLGPVIRWRLREQKGIGGTMLRDALSYTFCGCCAAVQDAREIGWALPEEVEKIGNKVEKTAKSMKNQPPPDQSEDMTRE